MKSDQISSKNLGKNFLSAVRDRRKNGRRIINDRTLVPGNGLRAYVDRRELADRRKNQANPD